MDRGLNKRGAWLLLVLLVCASVRPVRGEERPGNTGRQEKAKTNADFIDSLSLTSRREPIHIRSRDLEFRYDEKRITYRGDVVVTQGDVTLKSDLLTVTYEEPTADGVAAPKQVSVTSRQRLKEIVAEGHVEITSGDRRASGQKAVFNEASRTVVLSGGAVLQEGNNQVSGERVTVFLDEKRSVVEGGGKHGAQMVFIPESQEDRKRGEKTP